MTEYEEDPELVKAHTMQRPNGRRNGSLVPLSESTPKADEAPVYYIG